MKPNAIFVYCFFLCSTLTTFASVLPLRRHVHLSKRDININFNDFEDFDFPNLSQQDIESLFQSDMNNAAALAFSATTALGQQNVASTPEFQRWFGANSGGRVQSILQGFQNIVDLFSPGNTQTIHVFGNNNQANTGGGDVLAFVTNAQPQAMTVWRSFWTYPPSATLVPPQPGTGNGNIDTLITRAAILLHELFHFRFIIPFSTGQSSDPRYAERYNVQDCLDLAVNDPAVSGINPQSLMFYALDVTYGWTRNQLAQPPPPPPKTRPLPKPPSGGSQGNDPLAGLKSPYGASSWWGTVHKGSNSGTWPFAKNIDL